MQIVIDIPEEKFYIIKNKMYCGIYDSDLYKAIANGTPIDDFKSDLEVEATKLQKAYNKGFEDCRQAVLEQIDYWAIGNREYLPTNAMNHLTERMQDLPPVTPQPKTGHWIEDEYEMEVWCSVCGEENDKCSNYCPNCGAKMVEPQETETWNGIHAQITAPKGTFERIFNDKDDDNDI